MRESFPKRLKGLGQPEVRRLLIRPICIGQKEAKSMAAAKSGGKASAAKKRKVPGNPSDRAAKATKKAAGSSKKAVANKRG
jgi:hypothetical protein